MKPLPYSGPQHSMLFRMVSFFSRLQFWYLIRSLGNKHVVTVLFVFIAGATALGTLTMMAYLTNLMMLFPPLGPSAFILFRTPLAETASPRNVIMAHTLALMAGLGSLALAGLLFPEMHHLQTVGINWHGVTAIALAMGMTSMAMVVLKCIHPPAAATALIAAMGYLENIVQVGGTLAAVLFLVAEAFFFNRILGGLPYPVWRFHAEKVKEYTIIAGMPEYGKTFWQRKARKTFQRR